MDSDQMKAYLANFDSDENPPVVGGFLAARGIFKDTWNGEPAEVTIRRLRDGDDSNEPTTHDYALSGSAYQQLVRECERLQAENVKLETQYQQLYDNTHNNSILIKNAWHELKSERALAVRVAMNYLNRYDGSVAWMYKDDETNDTITWGDVKRIQAIYRELGLPESDKGGSDNE